jgi:hypothetical protein
MSTCRPNFYKYPTRHLAQPAHAYLYQDGTVDTRFSGEINATPSDVFVGLTRRWPIDEKLTDSEIGDLLEKIQPDIDIIIANSEISWSGSNIRRKMYDTARQADERIEQICRDIISNEFEPCADENCKYCNQEKC